MQTKSNKADLRQPRVTFQPQVFQGIQAGINMIASVLRPTLGPLPRNVAITRTVGRNAPEILDNGGAIARRIIAIPDRDQDVGAMLIRHVLWRMYQDSGDGVTTTAVIFQSIFNQGVRYLSAGGGNAMQLRNGLENCLPIVLDALRGFTVPLNGRELITQVAEGICQGDSELAGMLGEIFDIAGAYGTVQVQASNQRKLEREFIEGMYWPNSGWISSIFQTDPIRHRTIMDDAAILISDIPVHSPAQLLPALEIAAKAKIPNLVVLALNMSDEAIGLLVTNRERKVIGTLAVKTPLLDILGRQEALEDMALLTGGKFMVEAAGERLEDVTFEHFGRARRVWATNERFGIIGGKGDPRLVREHVKMLKLRLSHLQGEAREKVIQRIGRMLGGAAFLYVGGNTETAIQTRLEVAERSVVTLRSALDGGVVPGGGAALVHCQRVLEQAERQYKLAGTTNDSLDEQIIALRIIRRSLEAPLRTIAQNGGYHPATIVGRVQQAPDNQGFDVRTGQVTCLQNVGILDPLQVVGNALELAIHGAALALTTDVIVHRKRPEVSTEP
jgi:chaperonin GroEL